MPGACTILSHAFLMQFSVAGPATLEYVNEYWQNRLVPYGDIARRETRTTVAIRADGSRAVLVEERGFHHYFFERWHEAAWAFFDLASGRFSRREEWHLPHPHHLREGWEISCLNWTGPVLPEPAECPLPDDHSAKFLHEVAKSRRQPDRLHLGFRVQVWRNDWGEEEWLAPRFQCAAVKKERIGQREWGIPREYSRQELTAIRYGTPDPQLFDPHRR